MHVLEKPYFAKLSKGGGLLTFSKALTGAEGEANVGPLNDRN